MDDELQLISDGDGLAVIGPPAAVERFLVSEGLPSTDLGLQRLGPTLATGAAMTQAASEIAADSGRWVRLTEESAQAIKKYGLMKSKTTGLELGVVQTKGQAHGIQHIVQFSKGSGLRPTNPALLAGAAGIMAQLAMQQTMKEITDYLATIDAKVEDILRAQKDAILADMMGVHLVIDEATTIREHVGKVTEVTWSKVQATSLTIARTRPTHSASSTPWRRRSRQRRRSGTSRPRPGTARPRPRSGSPFSLTASNSKTPSPSWSSTEHWMPLQTTSTGTGSVFRPPAGTGSSSSHAPQTHCCHASTRPLPWRMPRCCCTRSLRESSWTHATTSQLPSGTSTGDSGSNVIVSPSNHDDGSTPRRR